MAEIPALFFARPQKRVSLHPMPLASWLAPSVASESVSASLISFLLIFAIALTVRRDFSTSVSSLPYTCHMVASSNIRGWTPHFVEQVTPLARYCFCGNRRRPPKNMVRRRRQVVFAVAVALCSIARRSRCLPRRSFSAGRVLRQTITRSGVYSPRRAS